MNNSNLLGQLNAPIVVGSGDLLGCKLSYAEYRACLEEADKRMKANNGHEYIHILKTRCQHCGASPKVKTRCRGWFETFVNILGVVLQEKGIIVEKQPNDPKLSHADRQDGSAPNGGAK